MPTARVRENPAQAKLERGTLKEWFQRLGWATHRTWDTGSGKDEEGCDRLKIDFPPE
jgi:hypothetical protein